MLTKKKIAVIGVGKLGETLIRALLDAGVVQPSQLTATAKHPETLEAKKGLGIRLTLDNR
ncbi:MAG: NAD(P)-binding domain-containing protein, partial [Candidatus Acidiferrales bacterium]